MGRRNNKRSRLGERKRPAAVLGFFSLPFAALVLLLSCSSPFETPEPAPIAPGMGRAVISLGGGGTRTLMPETPVFAQYALAFNSPGKTTVSEDLTEPRAIGHLQGNGYGVDLEPGTWELTVTAYTWSDPASSYLEAAKNTEPVSFAIGPGASVDVPVTVDHLPVDGTKKGIFSWDIDLPALGPGDSAELTYARQGGLPVAEDLTAAPSGAVELDSEYYVITILLSKDGKTAGRTEGAHIYPGLTTKAGADRPDFTVFTDADFVDMKYLAGTAAVVKPGSLTDPVYVKAYEDPTCAILIATDPVSVVVSAGDPWSMKIPATQGDVYLRLETSGGGRSFNAAVAHETGVPANGRSGIALSLAIYALSQNITGPGSAVMDVAGVAGQSDYAMEGETVALTVNAAGGYGLKAGTLLVKETSSGDPVTLSDSGSSYSFVMPAADITVSAKFVAIGSHVALRGITLYESLRVAIDAAPAGSASSPDEIILLKSIELPESGTEGYAINKHIRLTSGDSAGNTITRKSGFTGSLFTVSSGASLALDGSPNALTIDGDNVPAVLALITVTGGTLNMSDGATLKNNRNTTIANTPANQGGGVRVASGGSFTMNGGTISGNAIGNNTNGNGGGVYVSGSGSRFEMKGGTISGGGLTKNAANGGGVMVGTGASFVMTAGSIIGNTATNGGAVYNSNGTFTLTAGSVTGNNATNYGGAVYIIGDSSLFEMQGGTIGGSEVSEVNTAANGNGVYVGEDGKFAMSGAASLKGKNGVHVRYNATSVSMEGAATVDPDNDQIYLETGKFVTLTGNLTGPSPRAKIQPESTTVGTQVLGGTGTLIENNEAKFNLYIPPTIYSGAANRIDIYGNIASP